MVVRGEPVQSGRDLRDERPACGVAGVGRMPVIRVGLLASEAVLVAEVWDQARGVPVHKNAGDADESGRGLDLVHELTNARWGWYHAPSGPGKCVWAEFPISRPSSQWRRDLDPIRKVTCKGH